MIFFTSDHHFSHRNIIKYCSRPFQSIEEMDAEMIRRWNEVVEPSDTVYYLGDFALSLEPVERVVPQLNGDKILVMGNHDICHPLNKKKAKLGGEVYLRAGFRELLTETSLSIADQDVLLHHFPYGKIEDQYGGKYNQLRPKDQGRWLLCGHIHEKWKTQGKMINVGVDVWDFRPVAIEQIEKIMRSVTV